jgi:putative aldouronate transport system permease protein
MHCFKQEVKQLIKHKMREGTVSNFFIHLFFIILSLTFILPMLAIISISISNETDLIRNGYSIIPRVLSFSSYMYIFKNPGEIISAYKVTIITSVIGVVTYLIVGSMCAYALSRVDFRFRKGITFYLFFTMLFNGGLVPYYILMTRYLQLRNTYLALIIPLIGNVWYIFLMRTFFQQLPGSIIESATIDGASELHIYTKIILPLSKPVLATVGLLQLLNFWNSWFPALLFVDNSKLYTLQYLLQMMLRNIEDILTNMDKLPANLKAEDIIPSETVRMAMCIVAIGPMLLVFPFFQKYFVSGLTVGSIKE